MKLPTFLKANLPAHKQNLFNFGTIPELYRRKLAADGHEIIDQATYHKLTNPFLKAGGIIIRGDQAEKHLKISGADASYIAGANFAFIKDEPRVSDVLEEMFHAKQDRANRFGNLEEGYKVVILREIEAQHYLMSVADKYKIPFQEREQTLKNLVMYEEALQKYRQGS